MQAKLHREGNGFSSVLEVAPDRRCPVCDADRPEPLFDNRMAPIADIDFGYTVVACGGCGMVYGAIAEGRSC